METIVKVILLTNQQILVSEIEEVGADIGEPDCKLVNPCLIKDTQLYDHEKVLEPFLMGYTQEKSFMISSDKILTLADPTPTLLEKYNKLTKE